jgi:hypothetical protein
MTPSKTHSQIRPEPDPLPAVGEVLGCAVAVGVGALLADVAEALGLGDRLGLGLGERLGLGLGERLGLGLGLRLGDELAVGWPEALALRLGARLEIALLAVSHPASMHPMARIAARRTRPLLKRRMPAPSRASVLEQAASAAPWH